MTVHVKNWAHPLLLLVQERVGDFFEWSFIRRAATISEKFEKSDEIREHAVVPYAMWLNVGADAIVRVVVVLSRNRRLENTRCMRRTAVSFRLPRTARNQNEVYTR